jgi:hypothetical protein
MITDMRTVLMAAMTKAASIPSSFAGEEKQTLKTL